MYKKKILEDPFTNLFKTELYSLRYLKKNDKIIVSASGGLDSTVLLLLLHSINIYKIIVAHVDHAIRKESIKDKMFVESLCMELKIQFFSQTLNPDSKPKNDSPEQWWREKRYEFLKNLAVETRSDWIMTGHHSNDNAETILMNLSRQAGVNGLSGIPQKNGKIIRPLLSYEKKVLCDFVDRVGLPFRNDRTNSDISIPRNFIRQKVLKPWELRAPSLIKGVYKSTLLISEWKQSLDQLLIKFIISKLIISDSRIDIPLNLINDLPNLVKLRLIQLLFDKEKKLWSKHDLKMLEQFLKRVSVGKTFNLINQWSLLHDRGLIIAKKNTIIDLRHETYIRPNKTVFFCNMMYQIIINENHAELSNSKNQELVDWSKFKNKKLKIRIWREGDVFQPLGMKNKKKISDFLINEKIDSFSKKTQSVLTVDGKIAWVCGLRISEWAKITKHRKRKALLTFSPVT